MRDNYKVLVREEKRISYQLIQKVLLSERN
jgi:hypothetical protein